MPPDVVVIGGGPAGSTVSTLLAQQGCRVELYERERFCESSRRRSSTVGPETRASISFSASRRSGVHERSGASRRVRRAEAIARGEAAA